MALAQRVAIVGAGLIGRAWAIVFARAGCEVALYDTDAAVARDALAQLRGPDERSDIRESLRGCVRVADTLAAAVENATFVQENTPETLAAKLSIFAELDKLAPDDAILASSSSTIVASRFTKDLSGRHRCLIAHPVNPPHLIPLVELVGAPWTSAETIARAKEIYAAVGQVPIVVKREIDGFILNRLQAVLLSEAFRLVEDGYVTPQDLDHTLKNGLGLRWSFMGPFETIELNAPGGIPDYCRRYGTSLAALSDADEAIYQSPKLDTILSQWGRAPSEAEIAARMRRRDRRLAALRGHMNSQPPASFRSTPKAESRNP
ncbi:MAG: 3-hydroxyacyl-CoA dehydrogenase [Xanthobacteraceae bacterium]